MDSQASFPALEQERHRRSEFWRQVSQRDKYGERVMPTVSSYVFIASMDVDSDKEALFNEVYDQEHIPNLLKVAGVRSIYSAIYEIDGPHVLTSEAWAKAVEAGR